MSNHYGDLEWAIRIRLELGPKCPLQWTYPDNVNLPNNPWHTAGERAPAAGCPPEDWYDSNGVPVPWRIEPSWIQPPPSGYEIITGAQNVVFSVGLECEPAEFKPGAQASYYARIRLQVLCGD